MAEPRTFRLVATRKELLQWEAQAKGVGVKLNQWIRYKCNDGKAIYQDVPGNEGVFPPRRGLSDPKPVARPAPAPKVKNCAHGKPEGQWCWDCKGIAVIKEAL